MEMKPKEVRKDLIDINNKQKVDNKIESIYYKKRKEETAEI